MSKEETQKVEQQSNMSQPAKPLGGHAGSSEDNAKKSNSAWLVSFTDVMALMLTFFVLLFAMTEPNSKSWQEISTSLKSEFTKTYGGQRFSGKIDSISLDELSEQRALNLSYLESLLNTKLAEQGSKEDVRVVKVGDVLALSLPGDLVFESASAKVTEQGGKALKSLGFILSRIKNRIEIVGHSDPRRIQSTTGYKNNWALSLARARAVAVRLHEAGYSQTVPVYGRASGSFENLPAGLNQDERFQLARRVDIIVHQNEKTRKLGIFRTR